MPCSSNRIGTRYVEETSWMNITYKNILITDISGFFFSKIDIHSQVYRVISINLMFFKLCQIYSEGKMGKSEVYNLMLD